MKKLFFILVVFGILIIKANSTFAFNPKDIMSLLPPTTITIDVTLTNEPLDCPVMSCYYWWVSVYEFDGSNYVLIGAAQQLTSNQIYWSWKNISYDTDYHYIVLRWRFVDAGFGCSCCTTYNKETSKQYSGSPVNFTNFYPCQ